MKTINENLPSTFLTNIHIINEKPYREMIMEENRKRRIDKSGFKFAPGFKLIPFTSCSDCAFYSDVASCEKYHCFINQNDYMYVKGG